MYFTTAQQVTERGTYFSLYSYSLSFLDGVAMEVVKVDWNSEVDISSLLNTHSLDYIIATGKEGTQYVVSLKAIQ